MTLGLVADHKLSVVLVATVLGAMACGANRATPAVDRFAVLASVAGDTVTFRVESDVPRDVAILVSIRRRFTDPTNDGVYSVDYFTDTKLSSAWSINTRVVLDHGEWAKRLAYEIELAARAVQPFGGSEISAEVIVTAVVPLPQATEELRVWREEVTGRAVNVGSIVRSIRDDSPLLLPLPERFIPAGWTSGSR